MLTRTYRTLLRGYRHLPMLVRRRMVRAVAPLFTVGAMCVIEGEDGALLLVRQSYRPQWTFPGGLLQRREEPAHAARREVAEEVGVDVEIEDDPVTLVYVDVRRVDIVFRGRVRPPVPDQVEPSSGEILEVRWFPRHLLPVLQPEAARALVKLKDR